MTHTTDKLNFSSIGTSKVNFKKSQKITADNYLSTQYKHDNGTEHEHVPHKGA